MTPKLVPLVFGPGSIISQKDINEIYKEAFSFPDGSRERKAFINYAKTLEKKLKAQENFNKKTYAKEDDDT